MNCENLLRVADAIEKHEIEGLGFNMAEWLTIPGDTPAPDRLGLNCGTTACIAGWAAHLEAGLTRVDFDQKDIIVRAAAYLGYPAGLFFGSPSRTRLEDITPAQAVNTLRYAAATGTIDWDAAQTWAVEQVPA